MIQIRTLIAKYRQYIIFALVGVINTGVDFGVFSLAFLLINTNVIIPQIFGYVAGLACSFFLNKHFTFRSKTNSMRQAILFLAVNIFTLSVSLIAMHLLSNVIGIQEHIAKLFFVTPLTMVLNFLGYRFIVFPKKT